MLKRRISREGMGTEKRASRRAFLANLGGTAAALGSGVAGIPALLGAVPAEALQSQLSETPPLQPFNPFENNPHLFRAPRIRIPLDDLHLDSFLANRRTAFQVTKAYLEVDVPELNTSVKKESSPPPHSSSHSPPEKKSSPEKESPSGASTEPRVTLMLTDARDNRNPRQPILNQECFALYFQGPAKPVLEQDIYHFSHASLGEFDMFLVPIQHDAGGTLYEAIINRFTVPM